MGRNSGGVDDGQEAVTPPTPSQRQGPEFDGGGAGANAASADDSWYVTERLLQTLNQELSGLKEYVLTELRGEITSLRAEKVQLQSEVQELRHQQELLLSDRQQAQQQQWAQQFAQVMTQNLRQQIQAQVFGLSESGGTMRPEQRLMVLQQQLAGLEEGLGSAVQMLQQELGQHHSELSQQLLRMQSLEQQGEMLLASLVQRLQAQQSPVVSGQPSVMAGGSSAAAGLTEMVGGSGPLSSTAAVPSASQPEPSGPTASAPGASGEGDARLPGHPTDVASVMATMSSLQPPATGEPQVAPSDVPLADPALGQGEAVPKAVSRAAAMPRPPRLTTPVPENPAGGDVQGPDETFIADFPIDMVKPGAGIPSPPVQDAVPGVGDQPVGPAAPVSFDVNSPGPAQGMSLDELYSAMGQAGAPMEAAPVPEANPSGVGSPEVGGIAMPPGMVDRLQEEVDLPHEPLAEVGPSSPWEGDPPTTIASLAELTDGAETRLGGSSASVSGAPELASPALARGGADHAALPMDAVPMGAVPLSADVAEGTIPRAPDQVQLQRSGAVIAVLALLLWAVHYGTVQVLFHGAAWIADGDGFIAATWGSALVTFWIRMLMVLPFMIVIGQGLYPPLLPEMQAVFRDRDRIPLISITASSLFFFLAHFFLYGSIASSSATPAIALFFLYPALGQFLGWSLFNQRLSSARLLATVPLGLGIVWLLVLWTAPGGRVAGLASGVCYALFLMLTAVNGRRMNPMTLTVLQFALAWGCAFPAVFFLPQVQPTNDIGYVVACAILSATVGLSQLFGLAGRRRLGAGVSAVVQGTVPLVVGVVCLFLTDEVLPVSQVFGVLLVSGGAIALGWQRISRDPAR